jgi:hypothetical protein
MQIKWHLTKWFKSMFEFAATRAEGQTLNLLAIRFSESPALTA